MDSNTIIRLDTSVLAWLVNQSKLQVILQLYRKLVLVIGIPGALLRRFALYSSRTRMCQTETRDSSTRESVINLLHKLSPTSRPIPMVRVGSKFDGGYLVPADLSGLTAVFSPGVADNISFESYFAKKGLPVYLADASVRAPFSMPRNMSFEPIFIGSGFPPKWASLESWVNSHAGTVGQDLLLQMDIEGGEFEVVMESPAELLKRFRVIVLELHELHIVHTMPGLEKVNKVLDKLLENHSVVHVNANNCEFPIRVQGILIPPVVELTLVESSSLNKTIKNLGLISKGRGYLKSNRNCWYWPAINLQRAWAPHLSSKS